MICLHVALSLYLYLYIFSFSFIDKEVFFLPAA